MRDSHTAHQVGHRTSLLAPTLIAALIATLSLALTLAPAAAAQPTVNGLFYGDGDNTRYVHFAESYYGSDLYIYLDIPSATLYVAFVVDRSVNDNVFGPDDFADFSGDYMSSAGWGNGRGQQRPASELVNSEFASFRFACEPNTTREWEWQQGYACLDSGTWYSDTRCGTSTVLLNGYPPSLQSASSFAWNINAYNGASPKPWNRDVFGSGQNAWRSPYSATNPNTSPPNNPNTVIGLDGYPAATNSGDLSQGPPITYSGTYQYEWPMVFEWSVHLDGDGSTTGTACANNDLFLITGISHHSPMKGPVEGLYDDECGEENDCFPPDQDNNNPLSDYGDLPSTYLTLEANGGAQHHVKITGPYLGSRLEIETDGTPTADATGDGDEEDGVTAVVDGNWTAGSTQQIEVVVGNASGGALLAGWFDWNNDGDFADAGEYFTWNVSDGTNTLDVTVGSGFDWQNDDLYARFRIFSDGSQAPGGSLDATDFAGLATDGEVEDYFFQAASLPVTLSAFASEKTPGGGVTVRWQTASETDNVGFEVWGLVAGRWQPLTDLIPSREMTSGLPQSYETRFQAPAGLAAVELVDYDSRGRLERHGNFRVGARYGDFLEAEPVDWSGPRAERRQRLEAHGFAETGNDQGATAGVAGVPNVRAGSRAESGAGSDAGSARWKKLHRGAALSAHGADSGISSIRATARGGKAGGTGGDETLTVATGPLTHVAVTEAGIQRVTYEALRDGGLDLAGVQPRQIAVTLRGEPVARWIDAEGKFGPGGAIEFLGTPPRGDDALYVDANLYQVSVDAAKAASPAVLGTGKARDVSDTYMTESRVDRSRLYRPQSPTGDPWVDANVLVRPGRESVVTLDLPVAGPVADGPAELSIGLGGVSDLPDLADGSGAVLPEHNVEVWFRAPDGAFQPVASSSAEGQQDWRITTTLPAGAVEPGVNQVQLRFSTDYFFSLVLVDDYAVRHPTTYRGPELDFAADPWASGYRIEGFTGPAVAAYAEAGDGGLTRLSPRLESQADGTWTAELRHVDDARFWVTEAPHAPAVFTTAAPSPELFAGPADLVVIAGSSFVGSRALDDYVAQRSGFDPVVVDVEDVYNAVGFGMALPSAITDYLRARDAVHPFTHVQLVGTDCYDRLNQISSCVSHLPLPTAPVGVNLFAPNQNRLVDLDGDGVGDKALAQFSVREEAELATIVAKAEAWETSGVAGSETALLIAEESDGTHDFAGQVARLSSHLGWADSEILDLADHPAIGTARTAMNASLAAGRTLTVYSGHSSPTVWAFRGLMTTGTVAGLPNNGKPTLMVPLACETTYDVSPNANVLGHRLLYGGDNGAVAVSGAVALSSLRDNELMARRVLSGLRDGLTLGEAVLTGRRELGAGQQELQDNWLTQGDVVLGLGR